MPTLRDVARRVGVSVMTVSRAINHPETVHPATLRKIRQAIEDLDYVPNRIAKSLVSARTETIALLIPDVTNPFFTSLSRGAEDAARARGYRLILCNTDENPAVERQYLRMLRTAQVDGLIISVCGDTSAEALRDLGPLAARVVLVDRTLPEDLGLDTVTGDDRHAAYRLLQHVLADGHTRIALVLGSLAVSVVRDRYAGARAAIEEAGLPWRPDDVLAGVAPRDESALEPFLRRVLSGPRPATAVFAWNNLAAAETYRIVRRAGLRVPDDVVIASFEDPDPFGITPGYFVVARQHPYELGREAASRLFVRLEGSAPPAPARLVVPADIVVGERSLRHPSGGDAARPAAEPAASDQPW